MRGLLFLLRALQYMVAILTCCAIVALFTHGGFYILWIIVGITLFFGWKNEADTLQKELEL